MEHAILTWSIRALLMAVGTQFVLSALRVRAAWVLHRAWAAVVVAMLLLPVWTRWGPTVTAPLLPARPVQAAGSMPAVSEIPLAVEMTHTAAGESVRYVYRERGLDWAMILLAIYVAGFGVMCGRLIAGTLRVRSMMTGKRKSANFFTSSLCAAPVTVGWLHPALLLPEAWRTWPAAKLEAVLLHEGEHMRRRDPLVQWLALLNRCVFWFHPLAWWLERKLAALAEEACDAAVLAGGHAPHDYAGYLIEMAHSVHESGARIRWAGVVAFSDGRLPQRIRRILDTAPEPGLSRRKAIASAALCASMLGMFLACNIGPSKPVAAVKSGGSLMREDFRRQNDPALWKAALALTPAGAKDLETDVKANPADRDKLLELVRYYGSKKDFASLDALTLWYIEYHPDDRAGWGYTPEWDKVWDQPGYDRAKQLWNDQLKRTGSSPYVYMNAAQYMSGTDNEQAEQLLLEGRQKFQSPEIHWEVLLAHHYAWALTGRPGQLPAGRYLRPSDDSAEAPDSAYAQKVRQTLLASKDVDLLTRTVEELLTGRSNHAFAQSLTERALTLQPDNWSANMQHDWLRHLEVDARAKTDPASLTDADRMVMLEYQLGKWRRDAGYDENKANELLALAARHTDDSDYGTAIFVSHLTLGEAAMSRGDKTAAAQHLLAAGAAPPTPYLRSNQLDMSLPRQLMAAGERDAVSTFLDQVAKYNRAGQHLAQWAAQVRKGDTPDLRPDFRNRDRHAG